MTVTQLPAAQTVDVIVPTFRRPQMLQHCLGSLASQQHSPNRVIVIARVDDEESQRTVRAAAAAVNFVDLVLVAEPGVIAAMTAAMASSNAAIVAFIDDDAVARPDWLARLLAHFEDPSVGAVGGRDVIPGQEGPLTSEVGSFMPSGKLIGNHHLGRGPARDVDSLKGVNMAFRAEALSLPVPGLLRGAGAQVDFEVLICAWARHRGWRIVYDPAIEVDHMGAPREGADGRDRPAQAAIFDAAFNSVVASSILDPRTLPRRAGFGFVVGTKDRPGLVRAVVGLLRAEGEVRRRTIAALTGRLAGTATVLRRQGQPAVVTAPEARSRPDRRLRVALVAHDVHDRGGMERAYAEIARRLAVDIDVVVVSSSLDPALRDLVEWRQVRVVEQPFALKFASFWLGAARALSSMEVDLVQTLGAIVPTRADVAVLQFCHAGFREMNGALAPRGAPVWRRINTTVGRAQALLAERWCYRPSRLRCFAPVSIGVGNEAARHYSGIPRTVIPNGVDTARFAPDAGARRAMRQEQAIDDRTVVALFVGGDWDRKGLAIAIEALAKARAGGHDIVLWVVGPGDAERFGSLASELCERTSVAFFGRRADTERFYQAADVFLFPTAYEALSLAMLEAASCGLPLVVPAVNGVEELIEGDDTGIVVERSAGAVAAALVKLAAETERRQSMGAAARRRAEGYTWGSAAAKTSVLYGQLMSTGGRHR